MIEKYWWLNGDVRDFMAEGYTDLTVEERVEEIVAAVQKRYGDKDLAKRIRSHIENGFWSLSSPIWANYGLERGLPVSCNGVKYEDSVQSILLKTAEIGEQTKHGAGTSAYLGDIRPRGSDVSSGGKADGPTHYAKLIEVTTDVINQNGVRRGSSAAWYDIEKDAIEEFLTIRDDGHAIQNLSFGVCIGDEWMRSMAYDRDPKKCEIWAKILRKRDETGYPYLFFRDAANTGIYEELGMPIYASNLCTEIMLPSSEDESFVCCLASLNIYTYDHWKNDPYVVKDMVWFLDAVLEEYIEKTLGNPLMKPAHEFAKNHRAIGIGWLGWHSYLQSHNIAFESFEAKAVNLEVAKFVQKHGEEASREMAVAEGEAPVMIGRGARHSTLFAIAPTTSSSFILGQVSPSVEPEVSNYYTKSLAKGKFAKRNPHLEQVLEKYSKNTEETWRSILLKGGSVQHLVFLSDHERDVFKTFGEINQREILLQAAARQKYIDQGQSINLMLHPDTPVRDLNELYIFAWELGLKSLYYQRSTNKMQEFSRDAAICVACEA